MYKQEVKTALRFNEGKVRYSLLPTFAHEQYAKVLNVGAQKYGDYNWQKGMSWMSVVDSLERHLKAFKSGEDLDSETNLLHTAHIMCNAAFLTEYFKIAPQFDDRDLWYRKPFKRLFLDLDDVCVDFSSYFLKYFNLPENEAVDWNDFRFVDNLNKVDEDFWLSCPPLEDASKISYPIAGYCTARANCPSTLIEEWLKRNNFPKGEIINVGMGNSKVEALKGAGCDVFLDDSIKNFVELNSNGINCFLRTQSHNVKYDVGFKRVSGIVELLTKI